jgi:alpha-glucosidase (family GH31 glycosyl hydrolase)
MMGKTSGSMKRNPLVARESKSRVRVTYQSVTGIPVREPSMRDGASWTRVQRLLLVTGIAAGSGGCGLYGTSNGVGDGTSGTTATSGAGSGDVGTGGGTTGAGGSDNTVGTGGTGGTVGAGGTGVETGGSIGSAGIGGVPNAGGSSAMAGSPGICSATGAVPVAPGKPTGNPALPPRWVFGTLWGTYADQVNSAGFGNVVADATRLRNEYEGDLLWIDSSWLWHDYVSDGSQYICFKFDPGAFPDPKTMISQLNQLNFHFGVWEWPWMGRKCNLYNTALTNKYFIMAGNLPASTNGAWHGDGNPSAFDFTNPATVAWWQGPGLNKDLTDIGVEFFKLDTNGGQQASPLNAGGKLFNPSENYTNMYRLSAYQMSQKAALRLSPVAQTVGSARGFVMGKVVSPGSDQYPGWWTDDQVATFGGMGSEISAAARLNTTTSAAYWGGDTGAYNGTPSDELYIRWAEYTAFSPLQEYFAAKQGGLGNRYPWNFSMQAQQIIETYNQLRYRLLPFRYNNGQAAYHAAAGKFTYPVSFTNGSADMLVGDGSNTLLVHIMATQGATTANVALPAGNWINWWTNKPFMGAAAVAAPIDQAPIFVRAGSIIPMLAEYPGAPKVHWTGDVPNNPLTLRIYPSGKTTNLFYEDDGVSEGYQNGAFSTTLFSSDNTSGHEVVTIGAQQTQTSFDGQICQRAYVLELPGRAAAPTTVTRDGTAIAMSATFPTTEGWFFDAANQVLWVRFGPVATSMSTAVSIQ